MLLDDLVIFMHFGVGKGTRGGKLARKLQRRAAKGRIWELTSVKLQAGGGKEGEKTKRMIDMETFRGKEMVLI